MRKLHGSHAIPYQGQSQEDWIYSYMRTLVENYAQTVDPVLRDRFYNDISRFAKQYPTYFNWVDQLARAIRERRKFQEQRKHED